MARNGAPLVTVRLAVQVQRPVRLGRRVRGLAGQTREVSPQGGRHLAEVAQGRRAAQQQQQQRGGERLQQRLGRLARRPLTPPPTPSPAVTSPPICASGGGRLQAQSAQEEEEVLFGRGLRQRLIHVCPPCACIPDFYFIFL